MSQQRSFVFATALALVALLVGSCVPPPAAQPVQQQPAQQEAAPERYEIAVVPKLTGIPWFNTMEVGVKEAAQELGVNA